VKKVVSSSQTKAKKSARATAIATAVAKRVANTVRSKSSKVAETATQVGNRIVSKVAKSLSRSSLAQKAPKMMGSGPLGMMKKKAVHQSASSPVAQPKKKLSSKAMGLSAGQLRDLEKRLLLIRVELTTQVESKSTVFNASAHTESIIKGDDAEVAEKQRVSNSALQEIDFLKNRLSLVNRALSKIEAGVFGICEETEEPIGYERLSVVPWARFSVNVQELHERKMKDYKVNRLRAEG